MKKVSSVIIGLVLIAVSALLFLSLISYSTKDLAALSFPSNKISHNLIGIFGAYLACFLLLVFGYGSYFISIYFFLLGLDRLGAVKLCGIAKGSLVKVFSFVLLLVSVCSFVGIFFSVKEDIYRYSGLIGFLPASALNKYLGFWGAAILLGITITILLWMLAGDFLEGLYSGIKNIILKLGSVTETFYKRFHRKREISIKQKKTTKIAARSKRIEPQLRKIDIKPQIKVYRPKPAFFGGNNQEAVSSPVSPAKDIKPAAEGEKICDFNNYRLPSLDILKVPPAQDGRRTKENIQLGIKNLEDALADFGVGAKVVSVQKGPVVTMYELSPSSGVKIQHITALADDIALAMKSSGVRIVAPIPGRGTVGIEIPNSVKHMVFLREVLQEKDFTNFNSRLALAIGKDIKGDPIVADLKSMPHLLIAGTTGSGKTVCVNSLISSILFKAKPNEVKFILVDPKQVELASYRGIPHLLHPIISDAKKTFAVLNWAAENMDSRYKQLAQAGVRNIDVFNSRGIRMPYIVIIIDELADLMVVAKDKIETVIQRLAQLSRAVGIHLVLATQRPSVDVITGVIKANFPSRISFKVSSRVDSRTVLDTMGAEKLLGKGDMLFIKPGFIKPIRGQGSYIDDRDIGSLTNFVRSQGSPVYDENILQAQKKIETRLESDELLGEAIKVILTTKQASASLLQRRMRVGYTRAARLLDLMEEQGVVGPFCGSKAREILVDPGAYLKENELT